MSKDNIRQGIADIMDNELSSMRDEFATALTAKAVDALEDRKMELAKDFFSFEPQLDELSTKQIGRYLEKSRGDEDLYNNIAGSDENNKYRHLNLSKKRKSSKKTKKYHKDAAERYDKSEKRFASKSYNRWAGTNLAHDKLTGKAKVSATKE